MQVTDDTLALSPVHAAGPAHTQGEYLRWTWPVGPELEELVRGTVTEAFTHWGLRPAVVDLLGDLAWEFAGSFRRSAYVKVAVGWADHQAMVSARTAEGLTSAEPPMSLQPRPSTWGVRGHVGDTDAYAVIRLARRIPRIED
ncbi:hypothetical protein OG858_47300 (plasmid) [Streptomyces europaeiscabiei]|uniref:hypothetical protein n=1 Tax=Streptomyces europaeiscabiei TaxID=146819 RepID=UPI002E8173DE|nr:hypothetical protein [Streptomyces europaeiscabiei]WUD38807.1 hypothetical protein OG858_47300 [Streptomyces europaeiscabiei]